MARPASVAVAGLLAGALSCGISGNVLAADLSVAPLAAPVAAPAPAPTIPITLYSLFEGVYLHNVFPGHEYKSRIYQTISGANFAVTPDLSLGGGLIYTHTNNDLIYLAGKSESDGLTGFATATLNVANYFTLGLAGGYGFADTDQSRFVGNFLSLSNQDSQLAFASAYVQKDFAFGDLTITPRVRVLWSEAHTDAYFESLGIFNPAQTSTLGELAVGGQIAYAWRLGSVTLFPTFELMYLYDFNLPLYQADRTAWDLRAGLSAVVGNLSFGAAYVTILDRDEYAQYHGGRVFVSYKF